MIDTIDIKNKIEIVKNIGWIIDNCEISEADKYALREFQKEILRETITKLSFNYGDKYNDENRKLFNLVEEEIDQENRTLEEIIKELNQEN